MGEWRNCRLGDVLEIKHGFAFLGEHFGDEGTHIVLTPGNFFDEGGFKHKGDKEKWYSGPIPSDYVLNEGDLLVAMTEQAEGLLGSSAIVPRSGLYLHNQRLGLVQLRDPKQTDKLFVYYLFNTKPVRQHIRGSASGTKIRHTSPSRIAEVAVRIPLFQEQQRIASMLSAYDALMENCQRRIRILETMARALYREWFVEFRFPGHQKVKRVSSMLGEIPEGWEVRELSKVCMDGNGVQTGPFGSQLHESDYSDGGVPVVMPKDLIAFRIRTDTIAYIPEETAEKLSRHRMQPGDIVYGRRGDIGRRAFLMPDQTGWFCGTGCLRIRPDLQIVNGWYLFNYLGQDDVVALIRGRAQGVTMPNLNTGILSSVPVRLPPRKLQEDFWRLTFPMAEAQEVLTAKLENLRRTRDLLLPRLMAGEVPLKVPTSGPEVPWWNSPVPKHDASNSNGFSTHLAKEVPPSCARQSRLVEDDTLPEQLESEEEAEPPVPIDQTERLDVLRVIRQVFSEGPPRERDDAIREVARVLGYRRTGWRVRKVLSTDIRTAVRRGILENNQGEGLRLLARSITDYDRDFLKEQFLASLMGQAWREREEAIRNFGRWLGFARTGQNIEDTARSLMNGLIRQGELEADGPDRIRRG